MQAHAMTQKPPDPSAMYRWKEKMSATDVAAFDAAAGRAAQRARLRGRRGRAGTRGRGRMSEPKFIALTPELHDYVVRHGAREDEALAGVRERTAALGDIAVMQISPDQGALMTMLTRLAGAERALELGTFTGYSAICIARGLAPGGLLFACELDPDRAATARGQLRRGGRRRPGRGPARARRGDAGAVDRRRRGALRPRLHRRRQGRLPRLLRGLSRAAAARAG